MRRTVINMSINYMTDSQKNSQSSKKKMLKEFEDYVDSERHSTLPKKPELDETPSYERIEYKEPTDEEIENNARSQIDESTKSGEAAIRNQYDSLRNSLENGRQSSKDNYEERARALKQAYDTAMETLNNDTLKRGLARSSIAVSGANKLSDAYAGDSKRAIEDYSKAIEDIDRQIGSLDVNLTKALDEFNIKQAAALTQKINELKAERQAKKEQVVKYNNQLAKDEYQAKTEKAKTESELYGEALKQKKLEDEFDKALSDDEKTVRMRNIYEKAYALLKTMSKEEAFETLTSEPVFRNSLNDYYYFTLYYKFK